MASGIVLQRGCLKRSGKRIVMNGFNMRAFTAAAYGKDVKYSNPSKASDGYEIANSIHKPTMPALGLGTWGVNHFSHDILARSVDDALRIGYRHLDCARVYDNEKEIGAVIKDHLDKGTFTRDELFVTSKLFNHEHSPPMDAPRRALESTLEDLGLDYVDSFLIHWPFRNKPGQTDPPPVPFDSAQYFTTLKSLHDLEVEGLTRSIGVCNASMKKVKDLISECEKHRIPKPGNLQIELHPYLQQEKVVEFCHENDIVVTAAMPLGSPERPPRFRRDDDPVIMEDPELKAIAKECGYSVAQVIIRWHLQRGIVAIPKATEEWMLRQNFETLNFRLSDEEMERIAAIDRHYRFGRGEVMFWREDQKWEEMFDYE